MEARDQIGWWRVYYVRSDGQERPAVAAASAHILADIVSDPEALHQIAFTIESELNDKHK